MAELAQKTYANALFSVATENNLEEQMLNELLSLREIFSSNTEYIKLMNSPIVVHDKKIALLQEAFGETICIYNLNLLQVLVDNLRFNLVCQIIDEYKNLYNEKHNIVAVTAITATDLSDILKEKLKTKIEKLTNKTVNMNFLIDE
ncbi:MAG: ATP synthase F1 subunit delta, partial [Oscillospiraceae bacterium]